MHPDVAGSGPDLRLPARPALLRGNGQGYAGLNLLAEFQPDLLKLDMALTRAIDRDRRRAIIVRSIPETARQLDIGVIAEGIGTRDEYLCLRDMGVELFQSYYFARPTFERFAPPPDPAVYD